MWRAYVPAHTALFSFRMRQDAPTMVVIHVHLCLKSKHWSGELKPDRTARRECEREVQQITVRGETVESLSTTAKRKESATLTMVCPTLVANHHATFGTNADLTAGQSIHSGQAQLHSCIPSANPASKAVGRRRYECSPSSSSPLAPNSYCLRLR